MSSQWGHQIRNEFIHMKEPETGETVYSLVCRIAACTDFPNGGLLGRLTGQRRITALLSTLPGYIKSISQVAPSSHTWSSSENIVKDHTQLPYFTFFDGFEARNRVIAKLADNDDSYPITMALGLTVYPCPASPRHPRYCFSCLEEDLDRHGFTYFHKEHQLPGVAVCWRHGDFLNHGCERCGAYPIKGRALAMPGCCHCDEGISPLRAYAHLPGSMEIHKWLADQSAMMVNSRGTSCENIRRTLKTLAITRGLSRGQLIDYHKLASAVEKRYGKEFLTWLNAPAWNGERPAPWIRRLLYEQSHENKRSPAIYFLLFVGIFFDSIEEFENKMCSQLNRELDITPEQTNDQDQPTCQSNGLTNEITSHVLRICEDPPCGIAGIADRLGIPKSCVLATLKEHGRRFPLTNTTVKRVGQNKLDAIRNALRNGMEKSIIQEKHQCSEWTLTLIELDDPKLVVAHKDSSRTLKTEKHRKHLSNLLKENPSLSKSEIQTIAIGTYEYLQKYDHDWFEKTLPRQHPNLNLTRSDLVDWDARDRQKANEIERYLNSAEYNEVPKWTTKTLLLKKVNILSQYHSNPQKFPHVAKLIQQRVESRPAFIERKLKWAIEKMRDDGQELSINKLRLACGMEAAVVSGYSDFVVKIAKELHAEIAERSSLLGS